MTIQTASNKFLKCHIQAVGDQGARLDMEVPVGTEGRPSIMPSIGVCVGVLLRPLPRPVWAPLREQRGVKCQCFFSPWNGWPTLRDMD